MKEARHLKANADIYQLLAESLNYPDMALVKTVFSGEFFEAIYCALESIAAGHFCNGLCVSTKSGSSNPSIYLLELEKDYTRMCFTSRPRLVPLSESAYKSLQDSTFEITRLYGEAGFLPDEDSGLPPDHIAVELEFMACLFLREYHGMRAYDREKVKTAASLRIKVLDDHLQSFAIEISNRLLEHASTNYYRAVGRIMRRFFSPTVTKADADGRRVCVHP